MSNENLVEQFENIQNDLSIEFFIDEGQPTILISSDCSSGAAYPIDSLDEIGDKVNEYIRNYVV